MKLIYSLFFSFSWRERFVQTQVGRIAPLAVLHFVIHRFLFSSKLVLIFWTFFSISKGNICDFVSYIFDYLSFL